MSEQTVTAGTYRHFKGRLYQVYGEFPNTETGEVHVAYVPLYAPFRNCSRTKQNFLEVVDKPEYHYNGTRFAPVSSDDPYAQFHLLKCVAGKPLDLTIERQPNEIWDHVDAVLSPPEQEGEILSFKCPHCGDTWTVDFRE